MKDDVINRQAAIKKLNRNKSLFCKNRVEFQMLSKTDKSRVNEIDACIAVLLNLPSAQPEIIRCRDCKHYDPYGSGEAFYCPEGIDGCYPDDFCSYAERRTDGDG